MKFASIPIEQAIGKILAHNIARLDGRTAYRKGKVITQEDVPALRNEGYARIYVAELEEGDLSEDQAAKQVAQAAMGVGLELKTPSEGRASLKAKYRGVVKIDEARLEGINRCEGIAFASLPSYQVVNAGQTVANVKIIPYGIPEKVIGQALEAAKGEGAVIENYELQPLPVGILYSGEPAAQNRIVHTFDLPLRQRVESCGSLVTTVDFVRMDSSQDTTLLASALRCQVEAGVKMIIMASETSIMDVEDIAPSAVVQAGGEVVSVGAPVDPGNLMMIAYLGDVPILGVPGCARSPKKNVIDQVLPALLSGERLTRADIARLGYGGLLSA